MEKKTSLSQDSFTLQRNVSRLVLYPMKWKFPQPAMATLRFAHMKPNMTKGTDRHHGGGRRAANSSKCCRAHSQKSLHSQQHWTWPRSFSAFPYERLWETSEPAYLITHLSVTVSGSDVLWTEWVNKLLAWAQREDQSSRKASSMVTIQTALVGGGCSFKSYFDGQTATQTLSTLRNKLASLCMEWRGR